MGCHSLLQGSRPAGNRQRNSRSTNLQIATSEPEDSEGSREASWLKLVVNGLEGFPDGSVIKNPPANAGDVVRSLGREDPLEKEMAIHASILAWENPMDRGAWGGKELDTA